MKKKWIACLTALVLALGLGLSACKKPDDGGTDGDETSNKTYFEAKQVFYLDLTMGSPIGRLDELVNNPGTLTFETDGKAKMNVTFNEWAHSLMEENDLFIDDFTHDDTYELNEARTKLTYRSTRESLSAEPMTAAIETLDNGSLRFQLNIHNAIPNTKLTFYNDAELLPPLVVCDVAFTVEGDNIEGTLPENAQCGENREFTLPTPTFTNGTKEFVGWSDGEAIYQPGHKYVVTDDVTFTAVWGDFYTLTFAGGEGATGTAPAMEKQQAGAEITLPENTFTNGKKVFNGWKTGYKTYQAGDKYTVTADTTFTAQWLNKVTVTFAGGEGATGTPPTAFVDQIEKTKITLPENPFTNGDKIFAGWKGTASTIYKAGAQYTVPAADVTLTAVWHNKVSIAFAGGEGATGETAAVTDAEETTKITLPENGYTKTGYVFAGWSDGESSYQPGDKYTVPAQNVTMNAVWNKLVTLSFAGGEGATGTAPETITDAQETRKVLLPENTFENTDKEFGGWSDGTKTYQPHDSYTVTDRNVTFTAVWVTGQFAPYRVVFRSEQAVPVKAGVDVNLDALMAMTEININPDLTADYVIKFKADSDKDFVKNVEALGMTIAELRALEVEYRGVPYTCDKAAKTVTLELGENKTLVLTYTQTAKNVDEGVLYNRLETSIAFALGDLTTLRFTALDEKPSYLSEAKYFTGKYSFFTVKMWLHPDGTGELNAVIMTLPVFHQFNADKTALIWLGDYGGSLAGAVRTENGKMIITISLNGSSIDMTETAA